MRTPLVLGLLLIAACSRQVAVEEPGPALRTSAPASGPASPGVTASADAPRAPAPVPESAAAEHTASAAAGIDWRHSDVDAAFAEARVAHKPVFLYWGATWCPPCNQVKATIFNRQDFIERSRAFVAVYIDGDSPNAQQLGARFKVSGYPSMLLFRPDGTELTRLPGEVEGQRYMEVLTLGINGGRPVRETLQQALEGGRGLTEADWRMLAFYSWETDEQQLVTKEHLVPTLARLVKACPARYGDTSERLALESIRAGATAKNPRTSPEAYRTLVAVLGDPVEARRNFDILTDSVGATVRYASAANSSERTELVRAWDAMLERTSDDTSLSQTDRLGALASRVELARLQIPKGALDAALVDEVRQQVARADHETSNAYERQSVINAAAQTLADAGLMDESDALLKAELSRSHAPYYFMVDLASNARTRGDKATALDWLARAYAAAEGPATRLQWGVLYVRGLIELAPEDEARIEQVSEAVLNELGGNPDLLYERNRASLARLGRVLDQWDHNHQHAAARAQIAARLVPVCEAATADAGLRARCEHFFDEHGKAM
jgi:thiol-disulfide isomerase/thioredoxin